jgi:hypothetical protein
MLKLLHIELMVRKSMNGGIGMVDTTTKSNHYLIGLLLDDDATSHQLLRIATLS